MAARTWSGHGRGDHPGLMAAVRTKAPSYRIVSSPSYPSLLDISFSSIACGISPKGGSEQTTTENCASSGTGTPNLAPCLSLEHS